MEDPATAHDPRPAQPERGQAEEIAKLPKEKGGRQGPEPTRYGDWENKGIASDF